MPLVALRAQSDTKSLNLKKAGGGRYSPVRCAVSL